VTEAISELPDALVLGAGGTLGEAWLRGVLGGLEAGAGLDFRACEYLLGTSAGSMDEMRLINLFCKLITFTSDQEALGSSEY